MVEHPQASLDQVVTGNLISLFQSVGTLKFKSTLLFQGVNTRTRRWRGYRYRGISWGISISAVFHLASVVAVTSNCTWSNYMQNKQSIHVSVIREHWGEQVCCQRTTASATTCSANLWNIRGFCAPGAISQRGPHPMPRPTKVLLFECRLSGKKQKLLNIHACRFVSGLFSSNHTTV